ncbi:MAG TPA: pectinesterase family protein, partial [Opitutaceae bacterium]|nr:pectinesterase family protein [Opitutaceae bacterium]
MSPRTIALLAIALLASAPPMAAAGTAAPPLDLAHAFPAPGAVNVCPDTPLRLTFPAPPALGAAGRIRIIDAADQRVVETIDVSAVTATQAVGGLPDYKYYPVILAGREATIHPKNGELAYGHTYCVTIDAGAFRLGDRDCAGVDAPTAWRFTTKAAPPAPGTTWLTVAADGTGDFCTVQGALDFIPEGNTTPTTIFLRKGTYTEMVFFTHKDAITLRGEDRQQCVIEYATNERFNPAGGNPYADSADPSAASHTRGHIYHRGVLLAHRVNDLTIANLTIRNTTPQGGSQAEAIILNGTPTARAILKDVDLYSYQDTLQINGQAYLRDCYIEGDVDFMWGTGPCYFEGCTCRALRSGA